MKPQDIPLFTRGQVKSLFKLWQHHYCDDDGRPGDTITPVTFIEFIESTDPILAGDGAVGVPLGTHLFVGIEPDGHIHS